MSIPNDEYKPYEITSICKEDIRSVFHGCCNYPEKKMKRIMKRIDDMTDTEMNYLASKMADDYMNQLYWSSLEIIFCDRFLKEEGLI